MNQYLANVLVKTEAQKQAQEKTPYYEFEYDIKAIKIQILS